MYFHLIQALNGHGCFNKLIQNMKQRKLGMQVKTAIG
ncbi:unnamed protein product [Tenebrio molitor]|nr:unnamed protein product [Tenebrio molitor]